MIEERKEPEDRDRARTEQDKKQDRRRSLERRSEIDKESQGEGSNVR